MNNYMKGTTVYKVSHIYNHIKECLDNNKSFSIMRMGNAEFSSMMAGTVSKRKNIEQGIPPEKGKEVVKMLIDSCNRSDYVASLGAWFTDGQFFDKNIKPTSVFREWERVHKEVGITNTNFVNPDIGYLLFIEGEYNLWNIIRNKRICLITSFPELGDIIGCEIISIPEESPRNDKLDIPPCGVWHYDKYENVKERIKNRIDDIDIFLIAGGFLAKGYSIWTKDCGGIGLDIGRIVNTWAGKGIGPQGMGRMSNFMEVSPNDPLSLQLTEIGKQYDGKF